MTLAAGTPAYITQPQFDRILAQLDNYVNKTFANFLWKTGCRVSEALSLTGNDLNTTENTVRIPWLKHARAKKQYACSSPTCGRPTRKLCQHAQPHRAGAHCKQKPCQRPCSPTTQQEDAPELRQRYRTLPLRSDFIRELAKLTNSTPEKKLFPFTRQWAWDFLTNAGLAAGVSVQEDGRTRPIRPHVLRHSFAVAWMKARGDPTRLQRWLGHASFDTTQIYLQFSPDDLRDEYQRLFGKQ